MWKRKKKQKVAEAAEETVDAVTEESPSSEEEQAVSVATEEVSSTKEEEKVSAVAEEATRRTTSPNDAMVRLPR